MPRIEGPHRLETIAEGDLVPVSVVQHPRPGTSVEERAPWMCRHQGIPSRMRERIQRDRLLAPS